GSGYRVAESPISPAHEPVSVSRSLDECQCWSMDLARTENLALPCRRSLRDRSLGSQVGFCHAPPDRLEVARRCGVPTVEWFSRRLWTRITSAHEVGDEMDCVKRIAREFDRWQQHHQLLAFAVAVVKKFSDDQAGNLVALLAYFAFVATFPLLLALTTILGLV